MKLIKLSPLKCSYLERMYDLLYFYHKQNKLVVIRNDGTKTVNPIKNLKFIHLKASGFCHNNCVIIPIQQHNDFFIKFNFWNGCNNTVELGSDNAIRMIAHIQGNNGYAKIGNNNRMEATLYMYCSDVTTFNIGNNNLFSDTITFWAGEGHCVINPETKKVTNMGGCLSIGNNNWICQRVSFMKRAKISNGCVIGYGSVVSRQFDEDNCAIAGNPATVVKHNILWAETFPWTYNGETYRELPRNKK